MIVIVMGVSGSGKSTVGTRIAAAKGWPFLDGDTLHPAANVAKMVAGHPLSDDDRAPWLAAIAARMDAWIDAGVDAVVTCSALKRAYRDMLRGDRPDVWFVFLDVDERLLSARIAGRRGHFMPPSLLPSQLATLEPPEPDEPVVTVVIDREIAPAKIAYAARAALERRIASNIDAEAPAGEGG